MNEDDITLLLDAVRRLVNEKLIPAEAQIDRQHRIPDELLDLMRQMGLFAYAIPAEHGGLGLNKWAEVRMIFEFCRAAPAYRSYVGTTNGVGGKSIVVDGTEAQKQRYLPAVAAGELIVSFCLTEPGSGSDAKSLSTTARREGDRYVLNGSKRFISNAPIAGLFTVMARTDPDDKSAAGISAFLVEAGTPGLHVDPPLEKMGQLGAPTADVIFSDCRIPGEALLGGIEGQGFITAMKVLDDARIHMGAVCVGLSARLLEEMTAYAMERQQFGKPIAEFQLIQAMIADSEAEYLAARAMVEQTARQMDAGENVTKAAAASKYFASETVWRIADRAVQVHGGYGYMRETAVERLFRDARLLRIFEGTSQIMQLVIAREAMKEYKAAH
jgi:acyl-CoA dehydrogenase